MQPCAPWAPVLWSAISMTRARCAAWPGLRTASCIWHRRPGRAIRIRAPATSCAACAGAAYRVRWCMAPPAASMATAAVIGLQRRGRCGPPRRVPAAAWTQKAAFAASRQPPVPACCAFPGFTRQTGKAERRWPGSSAAARCWWRRRMCTPTISMPMTWPALAGWRCGGAARGGSTTSTMTASCAWATTLTRLQPCMVCRFRHGFRARKRRRNSARSK